MVHPTNGDTVMSKETMEWLNENILVGQINKHGRAWWKRDEDNADTDRPNHFEGFVPIELVRRSLFGWEAVYEDAHRTRLLPEGVTTELVPEFRFVSHGVTGKVFGVVSQAHGIHQYEQVLVDNLGLILDVSERELGISSAGLLDGGGTAWVQVEPPEGVTIGGDTLHPFLCAYTSHNGKYATQYRTGSTRIVCDNTLSMFDRGRGDVYKLRHTKNSMLRVAEAREVLKLAFTSFDQLALDVDRLQNTPVSPAAFDRIMAVILPAPTDATPRMTTTWQKRTDEVREMFKADPRVLPWTGTAWGVIQTFNTWETWKRPIRKGLRFERNMHTFLSGDVRKNDGNVMATTMRVLADMETVS